MYRRNPDGAVVVLSGAALVAVIVAILAARPARAAPEDETGQKLDYLADLAEAQIQQLQRLVEIGEQLIGQVPIVLEPKIVPGLVSVPLEPQLLNRAIQAMRHQGKASFPAIRLAWSCPAGAITDFPIDLAANTIATCNFWELSSDYYDRNIVVNVYVDDGLVTPSGIALTGPTKVNYGEYYIKRRGVLISTDNPTATDAILSYEGQGCFLEKSFYEEFYAPIIDYMHRVLEGVAYQERELRAPCPPSPLRRW